MEIVGEVADVELFGDGGESSEILGEQDADVEVSATWP